jgi:hypothetical protein
VPPVNRGEEGTSRPLKHFFASLPRWAIVLHA